MLISMASMTTSTTTINPTSCSSLFNTNLTPKQPFIGLSSTTTTPKPPHSFRPLSLIKTQPFPPLSLLRPRLSSSSASASASASFDGFETKDETFSSEEQDPEAESPQEQEEEEEENTSGNVGDDSGRLYVGNLPFSMDASQLAQIFGEAGSVVTVEVIYDKVTDRSRGFSFVTMASVEEAQEAIRLFDGSEIGGRNVKVNFPQVPRGGEKEVMGQKMRDMNRGYVDSPHKIYAGNLSWRLTSVDLRGAFSDQPGMLSAKVIYERDTGRSRGFGFVSFETPDAARAALDAMNGSEVEGRPLRLNLAVDRSSGQAPEAVAEEVVESGELLAGVNT